MDVTTTLAKAKNSLARPASYTNAPGVRGWLRENRLKRIRSKCDFKLGMKYIRETKAQTHLRTRWLYLESQKLCRVIQGQRATETIFTYPANAACVMESVKSFAIEWLDWGAEYFRNNPQEFFTRRK